MIRDGMAAQSKDHPYVSDSTFFPHATPLRMRHWERILCFSLLLIQGAVFLFAYSTRTNLAILPPTTYTNQAPFNQLPQLTEKILDSSLSSNLAVGSSKLQVRNDGSTISSQIIPATHVSCSDQITKHFTPLSITIVIPFVLSQLVKLREFIGTWATYPPCGVNYGPKYRLELFLYYSRNLSMENTSITDEVKVNVFIIIHVKICSYSVSRVFCSLRT